MGADKFTPEARTLFSLRSAFELMLKELAAVLGHKDGSLLSRFESGNKALSYEYLEEVAAALCEASAKAAARSFKEALELADFALFLAERLPGGEARRARAVGYCRLFRANALRVATEFGRADVELARGWELFRAGDPAEPELLPEWRLYDLEASLRREQRCFPEALKCVERGFALCDGRPEAAGHILLVKAKILEAMEDTEGVLSTLEEAARYIEAIGDPDQLFFLRWMVANSLCTAGRHAEAAKRLPEVRQMAIDQGMELNLIRVAWLAAKVDAGEGRFEAAVAGFEQVRDDFRAHELPYEGALSSLDLAVLLLGLGRTAEVKELAVTLAWIFKAKGIAREALAALSLFCDAARQEIATVEKTKTAIAAVEKAWRSAPSSQGQKGPTPAVR